MEFGCITSNLRNKEKPPFGGVADFRLILCHVTP